MPSSVRRMMRLLSNDPVPAMKSFLTTRTRVHSTRCVGWRVFLRQMPRDGHPKSASCEAVGRAGVRKSAAAGSGAADDTDDRA
jgi:hypothetical protein